MCARVCVCACLTCGLLLCCPAGQLQASKVGAGNVLDAMTNYVDTTRTSSSALLTPELLARHAELAAEVGCVWALGCSPSPPLTWPGSSAGICAAWLPGCLAG